MGKLVKLVAGGALPHECIQPAPGLARFGGDTRDLLPLLGAQTQRFGEFRPQQAVHAAGLQDNLLKPPHLRRIQHLGQFAVELLDHRPCPSIALLGRQVAKPPEHAVGLFEQRLDLLSL
jgi:hypothetical protein